MRIATDTTGMNEDQKAREAEGHAERAEIAPIDLSETE